MMHLRNMREVLLKGSHL